MSDRTDPVDTRILDAAEHLFYSRGIQSVGVDAVAAAARVSKRTLYRHYPSKDRLVAAYLQRRANALLPVDVDDPRERILAVFDGLEHWFRSPRFRGCPFVNAVTELGAEQTHPAVAVAARLKHERFRWFERAARDAGSADPLALAEQLTIVFEGAIATSLVRGGDPAMARAARRAAEILIAQARVDATAPGGAQATERPPVTSRARAASAAPARARQRSN
jgi:AcrR family transcriptional regulator